MSHSRSFSGPCWLFVKPPEQLSKVWAKSCEMQIAAAVASRSATSTVWSWRTSTSESPPPLPVPVRSERGHVRPPSSDAQYATPSGLPPKTPPNAAGTPCGATTYVWPPCGSKPSEGSPPEK